MNTRRIDPKKSAEWSRNKLPLSGFFRLPPPLDAGTPHKTNAGSVLKTEPAFNSFLLPDGQLVKTLNHEPHPVDMLPCAAVATVPFSVVGSSLNIAQPVLRRLIHSALVDEVREGLDRLIFPWARVRRYEAIPLRGAFCQ